MQCCRPHPSALATTLCRGASGPAKRAAEPAPLAGWMGSVGDRADSVAACALLLSARSTGSLGADLLWRERCSSTIPPSGCDWAGCQTAEWDSRAPSLASQATDLLRAAQENGLVEQCSVSRCALPPAHVLFVQMSPATSALLLVTATAAAAKRMGWACSTESATRCNCSGRRPSPGCATTATTSLDWCRLWRKVRWRRSAPTTALTLDLRALPDHGRNICLEPAARVQWHLAAKPQRFPGLIA
mmetsp:Transcript_113137/g.320194  ORF Transcript_113137/g.320194 Transcript_113137/m.320194 type:complete len:244 (+) Transcript_113137:90-821(+)